MNNQMPNKGANPNFDSTKNNSSISDKVGDMIEKVGHKISEAGAPKLGQKIHDLGDKMEKHHRNPDHPHRV